MDVRVSLHELGLAAEDLNGLRSKVGPDRRGDPSLPLADAVRLVREQEDAAGAAHWVAWNAHQVENERWLADRALAGRAGGDKAVQRMRPSPARSETYRVAFGEAQVAWQKRNPRPEWNGRPTLPDALLVAAEDVESITGSDDDHLWREVAL